MAVLLAVALGGALGSLARYGLALLLDHHTYPWGTLLANLLGSFLIGVALVLIVEKSLLAESMPDLMRPLVMTGFLGGLTTFSSFSLQALGLLQSGRLLAAGTYILGSLALGIAAAFIGILATRFLVR